MNTTTADIAKGTYFAFTVPGQNNSASGRATAVEAPNDNGWFEARTNEGAEWYLNVNHVTEVLQRSYEQLLEDGKKRRAEVEAHQLTAEERARLSYPEELDREVDPNEDEYRRQSTYCIGATVNGYSMTLDRNVMAKDVNYLMKLHAMNPAMKSIHHWVEGF